MKVQTAQGDLLIESTNQPLPTNLKPAERIGDLWVAAHGEATGHMHALAVGDCELYEDESGTLWLSVPEGKTATLTHQEHAAQTFAPGTYTITRQREYDPVRDAERQVID